MNNIKSELQKASDRYLEKNAGNSIEEVVERHTDETFSFYQEAMLQQSKFSVVFNRMKADGTLVCVGQYVKIILPPGTEGRGLTFAGRLNRSYTVTVTEVDAKSNEVTVKSAAEFNRAERDSVVREIHELYQEAAGIIKARYADEIEAAKESVFNKWCTELDADNAEDEERINRILEVEESRKIGDILEGLIADAYYKDQSNSGELTEEDRLFASLVLPAKIYAIHRKNSLEVKAGVDLVGMHINGAILPKHWLDRYTDDQLYRSELNMLIGSVSSVAVIGWDSKHEEFICSRRAITASVWDNIEKYFDEGDIVQVRCIQAADAFFYGRVVGEVDGNSEEKISEFQGVSLVCDYPTSALADKYEVKVQEGGIYLCKVKRIDKERKRIYARAFRTAGRWAE